MNVKTRKKLIEVALPLEAINIASAREKSIRHGHPSTLHLWWARRPLATARAVIFAQMVDDPSAWPERFPTEEEQDAERQRLFRIIEQLVLWENTTNEDVLASARAEIVRSWHESCEENRDHPRAAELFIPERLPGFDDPFCGGGALPLEAQRLGLEALASDLNPVAVLISKALIEIPPKFAGRPPVGPAPPNQATQISVDGWTGASGLAEDVRRYGNWVRAEAERRIGHLYPEVGVSADMAEERPELKPHVGDELTVIAWLWARTVKSPNPAFASVDVPLISNLLLATKPGKESYLDLIVKGSDYRTVVKSGPPPDAEAIRRGTKVGGSGTSFLCLMSGTPIGFDYLREEAKAGRMGARLIGVVAEGTRGRVYFPSLPEHEAIALSAKPQDPPDAELPPRALGFRVQEYGMTRWRDLFTLRQLTALMTLTDLVNEVRERARQDASAFDEVTASEYADAIAVYMALAVDRVANYGSTLCTWHSGAKYETVTSTFGRQTLPMTWDYAESNPFSNSSGNWNGGVNAIARLVAELPTTVCGTTSQVDAATASRPFGRVVSTDPPYYDNIGYADLSDYFYVWLRRSLQAYFPTLFSTLTTPKLEELVANPYRHGDRGKAESFFLEGMTRAMRRLADEAMPTFPITIYYAFKQSEHQGDSGIASTGWETFLDAVIRAGLSIGGTWPVRTEYVGNLKKNVSALASSVVLVCRPRDPSAAITTRREFLSLLKRELPDALRHLQRGNIAPVDLAQSAIGPGMAIYTRFSKVLDADGSPLSVRDALALINQTLDEVLAEQEGDFDADTRWAVAWFDQNGFAEGDFGTAETLSKAKNTSVQGMVEAGILQAGRGKVRLLRPEELPADWNPLRDERLTVWEATHQLMRALDRGEQAAADLANMLGGIADAARELAYRLYSLCERKKRAQEAVAYNALVQSWTEIQRLALETTGAPVQERLEV